MSAIPSCSVKATFDKEGVCTCPYCGRGFRLVKEDDRPIRRSKCNMCGFSWISSAEIAQRCPKCGSYAWNKPVLNCVCMVCAYTWTSYKVEGPIRCPNCKSNKWNEVPKTEVKILDGHPENLINKWVLKKYSNNMGCIDIACEMGLPLFKVMKIVQDEYELKVIPLLCTKRDDFCAADDVVNQCGFMVHEKE